MNSAKSSPVFVNGRAFAEKPQLSKGIPFATASTLLALNISCSLPQSGHLKQLMFSTMPSTEIVHKLCHVNGLGHDHGHRLLRRGDDNDAVDWAVANGITNGTGNGRFSPNDTCTRAQVVTFLYRAQ